MTRGVPARLAMLLLLGLVLAGVRPATAGPKVYVGLFKDDAVAVLDPDERQVRARISVPKGPARAGDHARRAEGLRVERWRLHRERDRHRARRGDRERRRRAQPSRPRRLVRRPMGARLGVGSQRGDRDRHRHRPGGRTRARGARPQRRLHPRRAHRLRRLAAAGGHRAGGARPRPMGGSRPPPARPHPAGARREPGRRSGSTSPWPATTPSRCWTPPRIAWSDGSRWAPPRITRRSRPTAAGPWSPARAPANSASSTWPPGRVSATVTVGKAPHWVTAELRRALRLRGQRGVGRRVRRGPRRPAGRRDDPGRARRRGRSPSSRPPPARRSRRSPSVQVDAEDYAFRPASVAERPGTPLRLRVTSRSSTLHNFTLPAQRIDRDIAPGDTVEIELAVPASGSVPFFCKFHAALGQRGELIAAGTGPPVR